MTTQTTPEPTGEPAALLVGGEWEQGGEPRTAVAAGGDRVIGHFAEATPDQLDRATQAAAEAFATTRRLASYERGELLRRIAELITAEAEPLAATLAAEIGKPIADARLEVARTAMAFRIAGEEAERIGGEVLPLDLLPTAQGRVGITRRMPLGPVAAISPFNVPLSLSAHKLAPALAAGNTIVLKPDSRAALTLLRLADIMVRAGVPSGALSVLPMSVEVADRMVGDDRFRMLSFTGSARVGWDLRSRAGTKKVTLELGGNAAVIIDRSADIPRAVARTVAGAFKYAGQLCISVQRSYVHRSVWDEYVDGVVKGAAALRVGDPLDEETQVGPMISADAARRAISLIDDAVAGGARVLTGGERDGAFVSPTVVDRVPPAASLVVEEAFAPVVVAVPYDDLGEALSTVNDSRYGLQAGLFTRDLADAWSAFAELEVGALIVNDVPTFRVDSMPFGGVKGSGLGREGIRYAIEDMTELRLLVLAPEAG
nr:aldehyde dehydrogenase family protein [Micromonospora sp. DSM 115978]